MKNCFIILAAGKSERFKSTIPKPYYPFKGKPLYLHSIDKAIKSKKFSKVVLVVNTASYCGFTNQYNDLQSLWEKYKSDGLIVLGVPSNSFNQEKKDDSDVKEFCEVNFNINFPLTAITEVKGNDAHEIFKWAERNYGKSAVPKWNFHKILVNKEGNVEKTYASFTKPLSDKLVEKIEEIL